MVPVAFHRFQGLVVSIEPIMALQQQPSGRERIFGNVFILEHAAVKLAGARRSVQMKLKRTGMHECQTVSEQIHTYIHTYVSTY